MNTTIFNRIAFSAMLVGFIGLTSCNKNDEPTPTPQEVQQHYTFVHYVDKSAYVGTFSDLTPQATDNKKAFEFGFGCYLFAKGNTVLVPEGKFGDKIHKFTRGAHGDLIEAGTMTFEQMAQPGEIIFVDEQRAYVALHGRGKIALINTSTLQKEDEIDLSSYAVQDNNPDPGCNVIRDGKMYVALNQLNSPHTSVPGTGAEVAIIDLKTKKTEVIKDNRTSVVGLFRHSDAFIDERGDIYFYSAGNNFNVADKEGFLRIRKGSDKWDSDYLFNLSKTTIKGIGKTGQYMIKSFYAGNGIVYSCVKVTDTEFGILKKDFQPVKIDIWNKTIEKLDLPMTDSNGSFAITRYKDFIVFGMICNNGTGYYTYNTKTGECSQKPIVTAIGVPSSLVAFE